MEVIIGTAAFIAMCVWVLVIQPAIERNRKKEEEEYCRKRQQEIELQIVNQMKDKYPSHFASLQEKHPNWTTEDFYRYFCEIEKEDRKYKQWMKDREYKQRSIEMQKRTELSLKKQEQEKEKLKYNAINNAKNMVSSWQTVANELPIFYLYYYYPTTCTEVDIDSHKQEVRKTIWAFKNGVSDISCKMASQVGNILIKFFGKDVLKYLTFVCIPASSSHANRIRFQSFSKYICSDTGMTDAFHAVTVSADRIATHLGGTNKFDNISLDGSFFKGKYVIIFDDIITKGDSMINMKHQLEQKGAIVICGITLGKTVHSERGKDPYDIQMQQ